MGIRDTLQALSPLDGRYHQQTSVLSPYFSEEALIRSRILIEVLYLQFLSAENILPKENKKFVKVLVKLTQNLSDKDIERVKELEKEYGHDVKAVEYFLRDICNAHALPLQHYLHIGLTSEDVNSIAYGIALQTARDEILVPALSTILAKLEVLIKKYSTIPMLARTHGQPAVPTTVGKELLVFLLRIHAELEICTHVEIEAKCSGAVGNFNAHMAAYPSVDWIAISTKFIQTFNLKANAYTTQIIHGDSYVRLSRSLELLNTILIGCCQDMWRYISDGIFIQEKGKNQVGSSTMPQKINPIDFENCEGNLGVANSLCELYARKLPISRLQRDLSDSTVKRTFGTMFAHCLIGYTSFSRGIGKIIVNEEKLKSELVQHPECVTEGIQTVLRVNGFQDAYEKLKTFSQGEHVTQESLNDFIQNLSVNEKVKKRLLVITPFSYIGLSQKIIATGLKRIHTQRKNYAKSTKK